MSEPASVTQASPLLVQLDSSATAVPALCLGSYTPVLADRVSVDKQGSQLVVLGTTAAAAVAGANPIGAVILLGGDVVPATWLACNGASVLRATWPALNTYWAGCTPAYPYGSVDGSHMTLPNIGQGVFPTGGTPGATGGEATHVLTSAEMPSHTHTDSGHNHISGGGTANIAEHASAIVAGSATNSGVVNNQTSATTTSSTANLSTVGSGGAHNNTPPFAGFTFIIRAA